MLVAWGERGCEVIWVSAGWLGWLAMAWMGTSGHARNLVGILRLVWLVGDLELYACCVCWNMVPAEQSNKKYLLFRENYTYLLIFWKILNSYLLGKIVLISSKIYLNDTLHQGEICMIEGRLTFFIKKIERVYVSFKHYSREVGAIFLFI